MKIPRVSIRLSAVLAVLSLAVATALLPAAGLMAKAAPNAQNIAVIDIGKILKNDEKFKQEMADLQAEVVATEKQLQAEAKDLQNLADSTKAIRPRHARLHPPRRANHQRLGRSERPEVAEEQRTRRAAEQDAARVPTAKFKTPSSSFRSNTTSAWSSSTTAARSTPPIRRPFSAAPIARLCSSIRAWISRTIFWPA